MPTSAFMMTGLKTKSGLPWVRLNGALAVRVSILGGSRIRCDEAADHYRLLRL
jgi:hypothetical protein